MIEWRKQLEQSEFDQGISCMDGKTTIKYLQTYIKEKDYHPELLKDYFLMKRAYEKYRNNFTNGFFKDFSGAENAYRIFESLPSLSHNITS